MKTAAATRSAPQTGAQAIERALAVLDRFISGGPELGVTPIARDLGLTPSTVHRIVRTLVGAGYLGQNPHSGRYHLGRTAVLLGQVAERSVGLDRVLPILEQVAAGSGESVNFVALGADEGVVLLRLDAPHPLRFDQPVGSRVSMHASASGKAMLAFAPDRVAAVDRLGALERYTEHTIATPRALDRELRTVRDRGYALDEQEGQLGVRCIAAPVLDEHGHALGAVAVQIPTVRMDREALPALAPLVTDAAARAGELLAGGRL